jgi:hypothetical protein
MKHHLSLLSLVIIFFAVKLNAQSSGNAILFHFTSSYTSFPDAERTNGHVYDSVLYDAAKHYSDSSVFVVIPKILKSDKTIDIIFWFHGWRNNIDSAATRFDLINQFIASKRNAILVLTETAKNSPDSYGGKLEKPGVFRNLASDILLKLKEKKYVSKKCTTGDIVLAGHSGAYRVIAYILQNGEMPVNEVNLFDALYSETDKFMNWIKGDMKHRFINWYTNVGGGTDEVSKDMMKQLQKENIYFIFSEEDTLTAQILQTNRIVFVHSNREHNDIINKPDNFHLLLQTGSLKK